MNHQATGAVPVSGEVSASVWVSVWVKVLALVLTQPWLLV
jgi:hypothetical protein